MDYVALLRGINVGGRNKVDMKRLAAVMTAAGFEDVSTYINTGNIFFSAGEAEAGEAAGRLEELLAAEFGVTARALVRSADNLRRLAAAIPSEWANDDRMKVDVMFLWPKYDDAGVLDRLDIKPAIDDVRYRESALIWQVDRRNLTRSGLMKLPGTDAYANMTVRNCNTVRKIAERLAGGGR
ncbi:MAG: DUF1697 domain-containing protein [Gemmatimonadetes bacterium]|nr:DUF1697 domain-containing protein [Gemmatimonadota bacterium]